MNRSPGEPPAADVDVVVVGAGLSGIGAACHLRRDGPELSVAVLEGRERLGGTWDLFRYPGVRSDSDMFTLGYAFRPWRRPTAIAPGADIRSYIEDTARATTSIGSCASGTESSGRTGPARTRGGS